MSNRPLNPASSPISSQPRSGSPPSLNLTSSSALEMPKKKLCNCKNSKCLKLYCECFSSGSYCSSSCHCVNCFNNKEQEKLRKEAVDAIIERNPLAFRPKIAKAPAREGASGKHSKGCNCKKSNCLKKYCECFQASIFCGVNCRCLECKNFEGSEEHMKAAEFRNATSPPPTKKLRGRPPLPLTFASITGMPPPVKYYPASSSGMLSGGASVEIPEHAGLAPALLAAAASASMDEMSSEAGHAPNAVSVASLSLYTPMKTDKEVVRGIVPPIYGSARLSSVRAVKRTTPKRKAVSLSEQHMNNFARNMLLAAADEEIEFKQSGAHKRKRRRVGGSDTDTSLAAGLGGEVDSVAATDDMRVVVELSKDETQEMQGLQEAAVLQAFRDAVSIILREGERLQACEPEEVDGEN